MIPLLSVPLAGLAIDVGLAHETDASHDALDPQARDAGILASLSPTVEPIPDTLPAPPQEAP